MKAKSLPRGSLRQELLNTNPAPDPPIEVTGLMSADQKSRCLLSNTFTLVKGDRRNTKLLINKLICIWSPWVPPLNQKYFGKTIASALNMYCPWLSKHYRATLAITGS